MQVVEDQVHIDRDVSEVFRFATDPDNQVLIQSNMVEFESETFAKGVRPRGTIRVAGKKIHWVSEITEFIEDERVEIRSVEAPMEFHITWTYAAAEGGGTDVHFHQESPDLGGFFGKMGDALVTRMYARDVRGNLANLKDLLET